MFSESYLYTVEAFLLYLSRLTDAGIVNMMRYEYVPPHEMLRALVTAVSALRQAGVSHPADHIAMVSAKNQHFTALLLKRTPLTPAELARVNEWASQSSILEVAAAPGMNLARSNAYQAFLALDDPRLEAAFVDAYPFNISVVSDDRPFFFRRSYWWHLFPSRPLVWGATPALEYGLILLLAIVGGAAWICVYLPMRWLSGDLRPRDSRRCRIYFAGTGLGYLAIEVALIQRFGLFLGHPNLELSVVLAALLLGTGLGSMASAVTVRRLGGVRFVSYVLALVLLLEELFVPTWLVRAAGIAFGLRVAAVSALVLPIGFLLGTFLPWALERLKEQTPSAVPWAWGINGVFSVLAPVLSVAVSVTWGIRALLLGAIPVYLLVGLIFPVLPRGGTEAVDGRA